jgi:GntR family transcriptional regulator, sialic acid-inducible nan operon repressor
MNEAHMRSGSMDIDASPIVRRKLSDEVVDRLKALIAAGKLQPGGVFPSERELMDMFGVGRPAIREALQTLNNMGLVTTSRGERSRVREITAKSILQQVDDAAHIVFSTQPTSLEHLKNARIFFERGMVREAATKATADDIARLHATIQQQRASADDAEDFISADMRFHIQIATISGNPLFEGVSEAMLAWLRQYHTDMLIWTGNENVTLAEHEEILGHIERHDADAAENALVRHLARTAQHSESVTKPHTDPTEPGSKPR